MRLVVQRSMLSTGGGIVLKLAGAAALTRYIEGMLSGVAPVDFVAFMAAPAAFLLAATAAAAIPARRAATLDPLIALRVE